MLNKITCTELDKILLSVIAPYNNQMVEPIHGQMEVPEISIETAKAALTAHIRTVCEAVIGEDVDTLEEHNMLAMAINNHLAMQRTRLNELLKDMS